MRNMSCAVVAAVAIVGVAGCADSKKEDVGPRLLKANEATLLANMRVTAYRLGGTHFHTRITSAGVPLTLDGDINFTDHQGYAQLAGIGTSLTLQWTDTKLLSWAGKEGEAVAPAKIPSFAPSVRVLTPSASEVDTVLALLLGFGQKKADSAQALQASTARWLRKDAINGTAVDVIEGPDVVGAIATANGLVDYWIDANDHVLRIDVGLGEANPNQITIDTAAYRPFTKSSKL